MTKQDAPTTTDAERAAWIVPDGWKLVPVQPTQEMCQQGQWKAQEWPKFPLRIVPIWQAMLDAASAPPLPCDQSNAEQSGVETQADSILLCISDLRHSARADDATSMRECVWAVSYRLAMLAIQAGTSSQAARASSAAAQPDIAHLLKFYGASDLVELIRTQAGQIERLQSKLPAAPSFAPQRVREG